MKKFGIVLLGLICLLGTIFAQPVAEKSDAIAREIIINYTDLVRDFVLNTSYRSPEITYSDMDTLRKLTDKFFKLKDSIIQEHGPITFKHDDASALLFMHEADQAVKVYFENSFLWFKDDKIQTVKRFFSEYGHREINDLEIKPSKDWEDRILFAIITSVFLALFTGFLFGCISEEVGGAVAIIVFLASWVWVLFIF